MEPSHWVIIIVAIIGFVGSVLVQGVISGTQRFGQNSDATNRRLDNDDVRIQMLTKQVDAFRTWGMAMSYWASGAVRTIDELGGHIDPPPPFPWEADKRD